MDVGETINSLPLWAQIILTALLALSAAGAGIKGFTNKKDEPANIRLLGINDCTSCNLYQTCKDPKKNLGYICPLYQSIDRDVLLKQIISNGQQMVIIMTDNATSNREMLKLLQVQSAEDHLEQMVKERLAEELPKAVAAILEYSKRHPTTKDVGRD